MQEAPKKARRAGGRSARRVTEDTVQRPPAPRLSLHLLHLESRDCVYT